jgi:hypothetical protein
LKPTSSVNPQEQWQTIADFGTGVSSRSLVSRTKSPTIANRRDTLVASVNPAVDPASKPTVLLASNNSLSQGELGILNRHGHLTGIGRPDTPCPQQQASFPHFGKIVSIDFTDVGEHITYIAPSDKSQFAFNSDLPVETGEAQSIYLLPIKKIDFKGTYQTSHPNLIVKTINGLGESKQYNFLASFSSGVIASTGIKIVPPAQPTPFDSPKIRVSAGQSVNADAVERGLKIAIAKQFVKANDPVVNNVRNFVFMLRNGQSVNDAIVATRVNPSVIESLAEMYLEAELPPRLRQNAIITGSDSEPNY